MTTSGHETAEEREGLLFRVLEGAMSFANVVATTWILLIMVLVVCDIIGRDAFLNPIAGVPEMVKFSIIGIVFLQVAHTHWKGQMIRSDGLLAMLTERHPRLGASLDCATQLVGAGFTFVLAWAVWPHMLRSWRNGEMEGVSGHFTLPVWPFLLIIVIGSVLLGLSFLMQAYLAARRVHHSETG